MSERFLDAKAQQELQHFGVALVYLYGSEALQRAGPLSDMDIGVVLRESLTFLENRKRRFELHSKLLECLERALAPGPTREIDLVFLQTASPILQFEAINSGYPLFVADPMFQADYEASVVRSYLDVRPLVEAHFQAALERTA